MKTEWARQSKRSALGLPGWRRTVGMMAAAFLILVVLFGTVALQKSMPAAMSTVGLDSDRLYNLTNVWTVHLKFAPDQWEAMEPKGGSNPFGGGPGGGGPGGLGGFNVARTLAQVFMSQGDLDRDGRLSREEFARLGEKWFKAWDTGGTGKLDEGQIRAGLDRIRNPGGGFGMMLQGPEGKRNGLASAMGIEFEYVHADLEFEGRLLKDVGVRYKGNGTFLESRGSLKRSLKIHLNKYVKRQGLGDVRMLTLQNNVTDASLMNEVLAYRLYRDAGVPAPRTAYARVFVTVPGKFDRKYFGLYSISERVDKEFAKHNFGTRRGAIFKPVTPALFTDLGADWAAYNQTYDPKVAMYEEQKKAVMELCRFVTQANDAAYAAHTGDFIDLPEFARYMAVMVYLSDLDGILGPGQNLYLHLHPKSQQFQFIPWDQDHSWGQFDRATQEQRDKLSIHHPWQGENFFLERMFKVQAFKKLYLARLDEFSKTIFRPERIAQQVDEIAAAIRPAVQEESEEKLARFDKLVAGEILRRGGFGPFGGGQTKPIKPFTQARTESIQEQLAGKSDGLVQGSGFPGGFGGGGDSGGSGLGMMFSRSLFEVLDENKDSSVSRAEFTEGFARLFEMWNTNKSGSLTFVQLRSGIEKNLPPPRQEFSPFGGGPGGPRGGLAGPGQRGGGSATVVTGTKEPGLFTSEHWGMTAFSSKMPNCEYLAKLYFAETYEGMSGPGQRVFSFNVQGHEFKDFDIWAKAGGPRRAYIETVPVEVTNGEFRIAFTPQTENPAINAIEVIPQAETVTGAASSAATVRIKAGLSAPFTDSSGQVWQPDQGFEGGSMSQVAGGSGGGPGGPDGGPPWDQGSPPNGPSQQ
ncbi:MAG: CotH kinase family protein [Limisphaerales bacterium]